MQCSDEECPYVRVIIGPNSHQEKGWSLKNVKCLRCEKPMELATAQCIGIEKIEAQRIEPPTRYAQHVYYVPYGGKMVVVDDNNVLGRAVIHEFEAKKLEEYWRHRCKVWKAIHDEIDKAEIGESAFVRKVHHINHSNAHSGIKLERVYPFCIGANESYDSVRFCYKVEFRDDDEDARRPVYTESEMVDVPVGLVVNFRKNEFDKLRSQRLEAMARRRASNQVYWAEEFLKTHPEMRTSIINALRQEAESDPYLKQALDESQIEET